MPEWLHNRARHLQARNPEMPESEAFAIATQQSHALGKSPKGYGTSEGKSEAKKKYDTPKDDKKTADPGGVGKKLEKKASPRIVSLFEAGLVGGFSDELQKIAEVQPMGPSTMGQIKSTVPRPSMRTSTPKYSKVNAQLPESPVEHHQPVLSPPPVRG